MLPCVGIGHYGALISSPASSTKRLGITIPKTVEMGVLGQQCSDVPKINFIEPRPFSEAASHSVTQEFYRTRKFITVFTRTRHWFLSRARLIQSTLSHLISLRSILTLISHLCLRFPSDLFPLWLSHQNTSCIPLPPFVLHALAT
jgi:hypothetical protein